MKTVLLFLMVSFSAFALTFPEFAFIAQKRLNKSLFIPKDFDPNITIDLSPNSKNYEEILQTLAVFYGFDINITRSEIYIKARRDQNLSYPRSMSGSDMYVDDSYIGRLFDYNQTNSNVNYDYYLYQFRYLNKDDVDRLFSLTPFAYKYIDGVNAAVFRYDSSVQTKEKLVSIIKSIDTPRDQIVIKLHIFESSQSKLLNYGVDTTLKGEYSRIVSAGGVITSEGFGGFSSILKLLDTAGAVETITTPVFLLSNKQPLVFSSSTTIPYRLEDYSLSGDTPLVTSSRRYDYKEVGFKINIVPTIVKDDVYLDVDLNFDDIISTTDNLPVTAGKHLKNSFLLSVGQTMLIGGIDKNYKSDTSTGIPILRDIPFIGVLFGTTSNDKKFDRFNIAVEVSR
ncbi:MAG: hypothetical protein LBU73_02145 [Helicobacteraceae bacterium]|jgi:type II secretory pathway component GspD/PulD (secretin)|nr:hypothetical protein [Helicobacteraceae bacterium]